MSAPETGHDDQPSGHSQSVRRGRPRSAGGRQVRTRHLASSPAASVSQPPGQSQSTRRGAAGGVGSCRGKGVPSPASWPPVVWLASCSPAVWLASAGSAGVEQDVASRIGRSTEGRTGHHLRMEAMASQRTKRTPETRVSRCMPRKRPEPHQAQRWVAFLRNHKDAIAAMDLFTVPTACLRLLYGFFVVEHGRRLTCPSLSRPAAPPPESGGRSSPTR